MVTATTKIYTYLHTLSLHDALPIWRRVWDRPDLAIKPLMELSARAAAAHDAAGKNRIREEMRAYATANGGGGVERFFAGKTSEEAIVRLADKDRKARLLIMVGADCEPSIEFLDPAGQAVTRHTQLPPPPPRPAFR